VRAAAAPCASGCWCPHAPLGEGQLHTGTGAQHMAFITGSGCSSVCCTTVQILGGGGNHGWLRMLTAGTQGFAATWAASATKPEMRCCSCVSLLKMCCSPNVCAWRLMKASLHNRWQNTTRNNNRGTGHVHAQQAQQQGQQYVCCSTCPTHTARVVCARHLGDGNRR
jgi:hypothetical protein